MLQHEFLDQIKNVQRALIRVPTLTKCLTTITDVERSVQEEVAKIATNPKQEYAGAVHNHYASLFGFFKGISVKVLFAEADSLIAALKATKAPYVSPLIAGTEDFVERLSEFFTDHSPLVARELARAAIRASITRETLIVTLAAISSQLTFPDAPDDEERGFQLWLRADDDYDSFVEKLNVIKEIYDKLCELFYVSKSDCPLLIRKIESGSVWVDLLGHATVITLLAWLVKETVQYLHRRFTTEGKIASLSSNIDTMDKLFELTKKIEAAGIDTSQSKEELRAGAALIGKNLNRLLRDQANVVVNGETLRLSPKQEPLFIEEAKTLKIGYTASEE